MATQDALREDFREHAEAAAEHADEDDVVVAMRDAARSLAQSGWQADPAEWSIEDEPEVRADGGWDPTERERVVWTDVDDLRADGSGALNCCDHPQPDGEGGCANCGYDGGEN